ncbi:MAG: GDP-mannose 4,6-dehydratase [Candidatus Altiarchaeota archaeon]
MKTALITGITGQDGAYLAKFLLDKGYDVYGTYRRLSTPNFWRLQYLDVFDKIKLVPIELIDSASIMEALRISKPDEVYHLAAQSFVGASFEQPIGTGQVTGLGVTRILEAIRLSNGIRFYQASTSELYGRVHETPQNEETYFHPHSPYACAKLYGYWMTRNYREAYNLFATNGILFNHESPIRGLEFVTRKITNSVAKISLGLQKQLKLGNMNAQRDWGYASEYVESMYLMLQQKEPGDFVIATNETHSVKEFVERAFDAAGLDWQNYVKTDKRFMRPLEVELLQGDYSKAEKELGWKPKTKFKKLVEIMVKEDVSRWKRWQDGERFPWDASNYPEESNIITRTLSD